MGCDCEFPKLEERKSTVEKTSRVMAAWICGYMLGLIVLLWVVVPLSASSKEQLSSRECENLGFTGLALCSDCNTLVEYVKDQGF